MHSDSQPKRPICVFFTALLALAICAGYAPDAAAAAGKTPAPTVAPATPPSPGLMPNTLRSEIHDVVIVPGIDQTEQQLTGSYGSLSGAVPIEPRPIALPNQQRSFFFQPDSSGQFSNRSDRFEKIAGMQWLNDRRPDDVISEALQAAAASQLTSTEVGEYGGGRLYQLAADDGSEAGFLNIVPGEGNASTILVIWESDPRS